MDRVVLFGAGASYGAEHVEPYCTPLGDQLYADLVRRYPRTWGTMPPALASTFSKGGFEAGMVKVAADAGSAVPPLMQDMTDYFAGFALDATGSDAYSRLLSQIQPHSIKHILLSTLNYECLLEHAASLHGHRVDHCDGEVPDDVLRVWKLHGSCNFIPIDVSVSPGIMEYDQNLIVDMPLEFVNPAEAQRWVRGTDLYAAMCIYTVDKPIQIGTSWVTRMQEAWADAVSDAEVVIVIGTRPHDQDRHIWEPLATTKAHLYFVGEHRSFYAWVNRTGRPKHRSTFVGRYFADVIPKAVELLNDGRTA